MYIPLDWLGELVELPETVSGTDVADALVRVGLEEEGLRGSDVRGPLVFGRVLTVTPEPQKNGKIINWCTVDVGHNGQRITDDSPQQIVCGAHNFAPGDLVVVVLPGGALPGGVEISARKTYGHVSHGMICSAAELGLGDDGDGIIVVREFLGSDAAQTLEPGRDAIPVLGLASEVLEVNVTPDRGYCLSMRGIAREYGLSTGSAFRDPSLIDPDPAAAQGYPVHLTDDEPIAGQIGCDRYVARIVRGVQPGATSPSWMQKRLLDMGMRPISLPVDVTNYVMLLLGQPLHAFDVDTLSGSTGTRRARAGEKLTTLDGTERTLDAQDLVIVDGSDTVLALAGVMGAATSEVGATTSDILIESAHFDPVSVARTSRRHRLSTEASRRFERGVDPDLPAKAAQLAVDLLVEHGGATPDLDSITDVDHRTARTAYPFDLTMPTRYIGLEYSRDEVLSTLRTVGCTVDEGGGDQAQVTPPSWRPDLRDAPDLVEEVARVRGYDQIPSILPQPRSTSHGLTHAQRTRRVVATTLAHQGLVEVLTYPFVAEDLCDKLGYAAQDPRRSTARVANPLSANTPLLRTSVLDTLLNSLRLNLSRGAKDVAIYELGMVVAGEVSRAAPLPMVDGRPDQADLDAIFAAIPPQPRHVGYLAVGAAELAGVWGPGRPVEAADAVTWARAIGRALGVELQVSATADQMPWHPGRCVRISLHDGRTVGYAGALHPKVCASLDLPAVVVGGELDLELLAAASERTVVAQPLSTYPPAHTDVALVVADEIAAIDLERALRAGAGPLLESIHPFDLYRGDKLGAGRKSLAYRLTFRSSDRTLTTAEVSDSRDAAVRNAAEKVGAEQRIA